MLRHVTCLSFFVWKKAQVLKGLEGYLKKYSHLHFRNIKINFFNFAAGPGLFCLQPQKEPTIFIVLIYQAFKSWEGIVFQDKRSKHFFIRGLGLNRHMSKNVSYVYKYMFLTREMPETYDFERTKIWLWRKKTYLLEISIFQDIERIFSRPP